MKKALVLAVVAGVTLTGGAQARSVDNFVGLETAARVSPSDGGAQAELASAYYRAGRGSDAAVAYRRVLALDNVMLETRTGNAIWSHQVARTMLQKTTATTLTSR